MSVSMGIDIWNKTVAYKISEPREHIILKLLLIYQVSWKYSKLGRDL